MASSAEKTNGVAVGSSLSLVIASFYMEDFDKAALNSAPHNPFAGIAAWTTPSSSDHTVLTSSITL
jgi:hypothetical protein